MISRAELTLSQLEAEIKKLRLKHGDLYVFAGGNDYPTPVTGIKIQTENNPYIPKGTAKILLRNF